MHKKSEYGNSLLMSVESSIRQVSIISFSAISPAYTSLRGAYVPPFFSYLICSIKEASKLEASEPSKGVNYEMPLNFKSLKLLYPKT